MERLDSKFAYLLIPEHSGNETKQKSQSIFACDGATEREDDWYSVKRVQQIWAPVIYSQSLGSYVRSG